MLSDGALFCTKCALGLALLKRRHHDFVAEQLGCGRLEAIPSKPLFSKLYKARPMS
jgi:hypothetical protein